LNAITRFNAYRRGSSSIAFLACGTSIVAHMFNAIAALALAGRCAQQNDMTAL